MIDFRTDSFGEGVSDGPPRERATTISRSTRSSAEVAIVDPARAPTWASKLTTRRLRPPHLVGARGEQGRRTRGAYRGTLLSRRGFNIYSLAVAPAESQRAFLGASRSWSTPSRHLSEQTWGQLDKLVNVVAISGHFASRDALERELLLATIKTDVDNRTYPYLLDIYCSRRAPLSSTWDANRSP